MHYEENIKNWYQPMEENLFTILHLSFKKKIHKQRATIFFTLQSLVEDLI